MNSKNWTRIIALILVATVAIPVQLTAQDKQDRHLHHHYQLVQIPTLGGPGANFFDNTNNIAVLNDRGNASGGAADTLIPDPYSPPYWWSNGNITHAFLWQNGSLTDLGSLPGTNNSGSAWISSNGIIAGLSENGQIDPSVPDLPELSAVLWRDGKITNLGTLPGGGYQSAAVSVNNRGEVVGAATNLVPDDNSLLPNNPNLWAGLAYGYQLRAFIWTQKSGMHDLGTLGSGTDAQAVKINQGGQVIGDSYTSADPGACFGVTLGAFIWDHKHGMLNLGSLGGTCIEAQDLNDSGQVVGASLVTGDLYQRAFLWQNGSLRDLGGSLGGNGTGAIAINEDGAAVGFAYLAGESSFHATLWKHVGRMTDLGTVGGDPCSFAQGVNDENQVVGNSSPNCDFDFSRAFLWEHNSMIDLNSLVPPNSPFQLIYAYTINQRGEIAANGIDANGIEQAALLIPCDEGHPGIDGCDYSLIDTVTATLNDVAHYRHSRNVRRNPRPRLDLPLLTSLPTGSVDDRETAISRDSQCQLEDKIATYDRAEPATDSSLRSWRDAAQSPQSCIPLGRPCYGPGPTHCCPAPFPHHSFCSSRTGWGRCYMN